MVSHPKEMGAATRVASQFASLNPANTSSKGVPTVGAASPGTTYSQYLGNLVTTLDRVARMPKMMMECVRKKFVCDKNDISAQTDKNKSSWKMPFVLKVLALALMMPFFRLQASSPHLEPYETSEAKLDEIGEKCGQNWQRIGRILLFNITDASHLMTIKRCYADELRLGHWYGTYAPNADGRGHRTVSGTDNNHVALAPHNEGTGRGPTEFTHGMLSILEVDRPQILTLIPNSAMSAMPPIRWRGFHTDDLFGDKYGTYVASQYTGYGYTSTWNNDQLVSMLSQRPATLREENVYSPGLCARNSSETEMRAWASVISQCINITIVAPAVAFFHNYEYMHMRWPYVGKRVAVSDFTVRRDHIYNLLFSIFPKLSRWGGSMVKVGHVYGDGSEIDMGYLCQGENANADSNVQ